MRERTRLLATLVAGFFVLVVAYLPASAQEPVFYKGKTIRIVVPWGAGSGPDLGARIYARHLPRFIPGNPRIIVENKLGAGGLIGAAALYTARPDGVTLGIMEAPLAATQLAGRPGVKYDMGKLHYLGGADGRSYIIIVRGDLPFDTIEKARQAKKPLKAPARRVGSADYIAYKAIEALGVPIQIVTGYKTSAEQMAAIDREEGDIFAGTFTTLRGQRPDWLKSKGPVHPLVVLGPVLLPELPHVPNIRDLSPLPGKEGFVKLANFMAVLPGRILVAPPGTPHELVEVLSTAFRLMLRDPDFVKEAKRILDFYPSTGEETEKLMKELLADPQAAEAARELVR